MNTTGITPEYISKWCALGVRDSFRMQIVKHYIVPVLTSKDCAKSLTINQDPRITRSGYKCNDGHMFKNNYCGMSSLFNFLNLVKPIYWPITGTQFHSRAMRAFRGLF